MTTSGTKWVYSFGAGAAEGRADMRDLLGGKGAGLAEMSNLGLPVPPGFTITTEICTHYYDNGKTYPPDLKEQAAAALGPGYPDPIPALLDFIADRLKVHLRAEGVRHDLIAAVFALDEDDLVRLLARVAALARFLATDDGTNLLIAYRRAVNIVAIEEKKGGWSAGEVDPTLLREPEEKALAARLAEVAARAGEVLEREDFGGAMAALATLRQPVDAFFDKVTVNTDDAALRENRLRLLSRIRAVMNQVADFSQIEG